MGTLYHYKTSTGIYDKFILSKFLCFEADIFCIYYCLPLQDKDPSTLMKRTLESLQRLLQGILLQDPVTPTLENILKVSPNFRVVLENTTFDSVIINLTLILAP